MIPAVLWTYWESQLGHKNYPFIEYCLSTFKRSGCEVVVLRPENVCAYLDGLLNINWFKINNIAEKVDCIRIALLYKYGGFWCDADTVILKLFDNLIKMSGSVFMRWKGTNTLLNGYFFSEPGSLFLKHVLNQINDILQNDPRDNYVGLGGGCHLGQHRINMAANDGMPYSEIPLSTFIPYEFPGDQQCWHRDDNIIKYITPETVAVGLNLSQYNYNFRLKSMAEHRESQTLFGSIIRYSDALGGL